MLSRLTIDQAKLLTNKHAHTQTNQIEPLATHKNDNEYCIFCKELSFGLLNSSVAIQVFAYLVYCVTLTKY